MPQHQHRINRDKFFQEMKRRGWILDGEVGWLIPSGRRSHDREVDWYESLLASIECPHEAAAKETGDAATGSGDTGGV